MYLLKHNIVILYINITIDDFFGKKIGLPNKGFRTIRGKKYHFIVPF